ncbi:MAG: aminotransferase class IV [Desulfovibrio sp.]
MYYWYNGRLRVEPMAVDPYSLSFRYGLGVFETMMFDSGTVYHKELHLERLKRSLAVLDVELADFSFMEAVDALAGAAELKQSRARINVFCPVDSFDDPVHPTLLIFPVEPPKKESIKLDLSPRPFHAPLSVHKSMNYMHYFLERREALRQGFDDCILCDQQGDVAETCIASLLFFDGKEYIFPTAQRLSGITEHVVKNAMKELNIPFVERSVYMGELGAFQGIYTLNSIAGVRPVECIGDECYEVDGELIRVMNPVVFSE